MRRTVNKKRRRIVLLSVVSIACALSIPPLLSGSAGIAEAVVRESLEGSSRVEVVYVFIEGKPASSSFISRLADLRLNLAPHRETTIRDGLVVDAATGDPVIECEIEKIVWTSPFTATVKASCREGMLGGSGANYHLVHNLFGWKVVAITDFWVS